MTHKFNVNDLFSDSFDFSDGIRTTLDTFHHEVSANLNGPAPVQPPPFSLNGPAPVQPPPLSLNDPVPVLSPDPSDISGGAASNTITTFGNTVVVNNGGMTFDLNFDAAAPASFRTGIENAALLLSAAIPDHITVNLQIHYSGTGGGASAKPDAGLFESYSTVRAELLQHANPGDTNFDALPNATSIQGQTQVAVWNAELKAFGLINPNDTTTDDGEATFATDINPNSLTGVALHELTHALGRVPYGPQPDIFDLFRFTSDGVRLFDGNTSSAPAAYFSVDGGNYDIADFGLHSDTSDLLNPGPTFLGGPYSNLTPGDPFNEIYDGSTVQNLSNVDKVILDALGFNTMPSPYTTYTFDSHGNRATSTSHTSDGTIFYTDYNLAHTNNWNYAVSTYDVHGSLAFTTIKENDGTTLVTTYNPHGTLSYSEAISGYNSAGQITYVTVENHDGSQDYTVYDHPGNNQSYEVYHYDPNHHLTSSHHVGIMV